MGEKPSVTMVHIPGDMNVLVPNCQRAGIEIQVYEMTGSDHYSLPGLLPLLMQKSKLDLLLEIMSYPIPKRKAS